jgi:hypothetical protein
MASRFIAMLALTPQRKAGACGQERPIYFAARLQAYIQSA